jgi:hypothetical protein
LGRVQAQLQICDDQIEELEAQVKEAPPEMRKKCKEQISQLILNREALERGLLEISDEDGPSCAC